MRSVRTVARAALAGASATVAFSFCLAAVARADGPPASAPSSSPTPAEAEARARFAEAHRFFEAQEYSQAIADLKQAYVLDPRSEYLYALGQAERLAGDCKDAIVAYEHYVGSSDADPARVPIAREMVGECQKGLAAQAPASAPSAAPSGAPSADQVAAELARMEEQRQEAAARAQNERQRREQAAGATGHGWRVAGVTAIVVGSVAIASSFFDLWIYEHESSNIKGFNQNPNATWSQFLDGEPGKISLAHDLWLGTLLGGGTVLAAGVACYVVGAHERSAARDHLDDDTVSVLPAVLAGGGALTLQGDF